MSARGRRPRLRDLLREVRQCRLCAAELPCGPRPVLSVGSASRLLIIGQAPGSRVHRSGIPFDDASGERLRDWLGLDRERFYDDSLVSIMPMGFCYPGRGRSGDLPPRPECARHWHASLLDCLPSLRLTLLVGAYAQKYYLPEAARAGVTETVRNWRQAPPGLFPLIHPSPRNGIWLRRNPWFEEQVLPALKLRVSQALDF